MGFERMSGDEVTSARKNRSAIFVLGMHRSGTSALSRMLSLLGCDLPKTLMPESQANSRGFWESMPIMALNDAILQSGGSIWNDWLPFNPGWYESPVYSDFVEKGRIVLKEEFGSSPLFVMKDPRCARIVPYWKDVFYKESIEPIVIIPIRNPLEVAKSVNKVHFIDNNISHLIWIRHVLDAEYYSRGLRRAFTTYDKLISNWSALAVVLQERLDISWPSMSAISGTKVDGFLDSSIRHHEEPPENVLSNPLLAGWLRDTFAIMLRWAADGEAISDHATLDAIRQAFNAAGPAFASITHSLAEEVRRAQDLQGVLEATRNELVLAEGQILTDAEHVTASDSIEQIVMERDEARHANEATIQRMATEAQELHDRLAHIENMLGQREYEIAHAASEQASAIERAETLEHEKIAVEARLQAAEERVQELQDVLRTSNDRAQNAENEAEELRNRLAHIESTLRQREEEIEQTGSDRALAVQRVQSLETEKYEIDARLKASEKWVFQLAGERHAAQQRIASLDKEIKAKDRELSRSATKFKTLSNHITRVSDKKNMNDFRNEHEIIALGDSVELKLMKDKLVSQAPYFSDVQDELNNVISMNISLNERMNERISEIAQLSAMLIAEKNRTEAIADYYVANNVQAAANQQTAADERGNADEQSAADEYQTITCLASDRLTEIEHLKAKIDEISVFSEHNSAELRAISAAKEADEARLKIQIGEISKLSGLLIQKQRMAEKNAEQKEWLRQVIPIITRKRWWSKLVTEKWLAQHVHKRLMKRGLFDADAYIARYPDVVEKGIDPLQHYIIHGMDESRNRMGNF